MINYAEYRDQVAENIKAYLAKNLPNARAVAYQLQSLHPDDLYLFRVIGYQVMPNGDEKWCVWETWNESTRELGHGTYMLSHDEAWKMFEELSEYTNRCWKAVV